MFQKESINKYNNKNCESNFFIKLIFFVSNKYIFIFNKYLVDIIQINIY